MDVGLVRLFVLVMRHGSFSAVARDQTLDPSSISRAISALEDQLGVRLFQRTTRQMVPTEAAHAYVARVGPLLDAFDDAQHAARDAGKAPEGLLRILSPAGFAQSNLLPLLPDLAARYPGLDFEFILTDEDLDLITERIDIAIRLWPMQGASHIVTRLCPRREVVCASPDYIAAHAKITTPADLGDHRCVVFRQQEYRSSWRFRKSGKDIQSISVRPRFTVSNATALRECVLLGLGPTLVPRWIVGADLAAGRLVDALPGYEATATDFDSASAWLVYPSRSYVPLKVRVLIDYLKREFEHGAPGERGTAYAVPDPRAIAIKNVEQR